MDTVLLLAQIFIALLAMLLIFNLTRRILMGIGNQSEVTGSRRRLGKFEESQELYRTERHGTTNSGYVITLRSKEKLRESNVREALVLLAKRQPLLRAVIKTVSNFYWFRQNDERHFEIIEPSKVADMIDLTTSDLHATQWQNEWYDIVTRPRDETGLLWQTVWFKEEYLSDSENYVNTIVFRVNHCIMDGVSGMKLCKQFLSNLNHVSEDPRMRSEDVPSLELLPSFYDILNNTRPWTVWKCLQETLGLHYIANFIIRLKLLISLARKPEKPYDFLLSKPSPERRDLMFKVFSERETSQIRKVCKTNGVTVTGALLAAVHLSFCKVIEGQSLLHSQKVAKQQEMTQMFAVNGLRACKPTPPVDYLDNFFFSDMLSLSNEGNKDSFWSLAREASRKIYTILGEGKYLSSHLDDFDIFTPREKVEDLYSPQDPRKQLKLFSGNYMSSVGAFTFDEDVSTSFKLHEYLFYSKPFGFPSFSSHYNVTVNGKMTWVVICSKFIPSAIEEQFANYCFDKLLKETQVSM